MIDAGGSTCVRDRGRQRRERELGGQNRHAHVPEEGERIAAVSATFGDGAAVTRSFLERAAAFTRRARAWLKLLCRKRRAKK